MIRTVITCDVCAREIGRDDRAALIVSNSPLCICIERLWNSELSQPSHICGEACLHKHLSRLLPNL